MQAVQLLTESPYVRRARRRRPTHRLVCLPFAGAGASTYRELASAMPEHVEVISIQLPGREDRVEEAPFTRMEPLVRALAQVIQPYLDLPSAFFGHSSGALVAYELVRTLQARLPAGAAELPAQLVASGHQGPHLPARRRAIGQLPDDELLAEVVALNGTPPEVVADAQLRQLVMPALRADAVLCESYQHRPDPPLRVPVTVFGGTHDTLVPRSDLEAWRQCAGPAFRLRLFPGDHFFLREAATAVHQAIAEVLV